MRGIELSSAYFNAYGLPMIRKEFPHLEDKIAAGLVGRGSECFGFDDDISRDHDFAPGFKIFLKRADYELCGEALQAAYNKLPNEYSGVNLQGKSYGYVDKHGVFSIGDFYQDHIGLQRAPEHWREWFYIPEYALATVVNGKVFVDNLGQFSAIRSTLQKGYPQDVLLKKLAGRLALMAQSGQYNYSRCIQHGEMGAARLALYEFVQHTIHVIFLLNNAYAPFYKWQFRAIMDLTTLSNMGVELENLLMAGDFENNKVKIEEISNKITIELRRRRLTNSTDLFLESHAIELSKLIRDPEISALHLMEVGE